jgi:hypothetical protein
MNEMSASPDPPDKSAPSSTQQLAPKDPTSSVRRLLPWRTPRQRSSLASPSSASWLRDFPLAWLLLLHSGLSVAPIGEITSHPPKVIASDHLTNRDATEIPARAEAEGISKKSLWTAKKTLPVPLPPPLGQ